MKKPHIINPNMREAESCKSVTEVFLFRPWAFWVTETKKHTPLDNEGFDMFVYPKIDFLISMNLLGVGRHLPVQIKSSEKKSGEFYAQYYHKKRFFESSKKYHQFILSGMDENELILADIVGQMVVHGTGYGWSEKDVLEKFAELGDMDAVSAYKKFKVVLLFRWYGARLPPL